MTLTKLLNPSSSPATVASVSSLSSKSNEKAPITNPSVTIDALRLIELTNRTSAVFKSQESELLLHSDPVLAVMRTFGHINRSPVSASLSVVPFDDFPTAISSHIHDSDSQMVVLPWSRGSAWQPEESSEKSPANPFDGIFHRSTSTGLEHTNNSVVYSEFVRNVFQSTPVDMALFVDGGIRRGAELEKQHLFLPFFGGPDDRLALTFLVQLCSNNPLVHAKVVRISKSDNDLTPCSTVDHDIKKTGDEHLPTHATVTAADTVYGAQTTETRLASDTADNILWNRLSAAHGARILFSTYETPRPLRYVVETVKELSQSSSPNIIVMTGRSRRMAVLSHTIELNGIVAERNVTMGSLVPKTLGDVGAGLLVSGSNASLLVMQEAGVKA